MKIFFENLFVLPNLLMTLERVSFVMILRIDKINFGVKHL